MKLLTIGQILFLAVVLALIGWVNGAGIRVADIIQSERVTQATPSIRRKEPELVPSVIPPVTSVAEVLPPSITNDISLLPIEPKYKKSPIITMTDEYNKDIPPIPLGGGPVQIDFYILLVDIRDINEVEEEMTVEYNLQIFWKDERLTQWNRNSTSFQEAKQHKGGYEVLSSSIISDIWHPDAFIDNIKDMNQYRLLKTPESLRVHFHDGEFRYSGRFTMKIACQMQFHYYPADTQYCPVHIKSYAHDNRTIFIKWREGKEPAMKGNVFLPNFQVGLGGAMNKQVKTSAEAEYSEIQFMVILRRRLGFHMIQTYLPSSLFVGISFLTFLVSRENVLECLTLCMTTLLTLTAMFGAVKQNTPTVSYVKGLDIWMVMCIFCVFLTLLEHTILLNLRTQITEKVQKKVASLEKDKNAKAKKRRSLFAQMGRKRTGSSSSKNMGRSLQEPLTFYNKASAKSADGGSSDSGSESSLNIQLRRYPQPIPPASIHLSPPTEPLGQNSGLGPPPGVPPLSPVTMAQRLSISPAQTPMMVSPESMLLSTALNPQFATMISKKAAKRFDLSRSVEIFFSKLIPISFVVFNLIYWPWLLISADYYNDDPFINTNKKP